MAPLASVLFGLDEPERNIIFRRVTCTLGVSHLDKARDGFGAVQYVALIVAVDHGVYMEVQPVSTAM